MTYRYRSNKYGSKKIEIDGIVFDSKKEAKRFQELSLMEASGAIQNLQRQVKYVLIPSQYDGWYDKGKFKKKCVERECTYIADFVYEQDGKRIVEDTKGFRTKDYIIKRKLMLHVHGIKIKEI